MHTALRPMNIHTLSVGDVISRRSLPCPRSACAVSGPGRRTLTVTGLAGTVAIDACRHLTVCARCSSKESMARISSSRMPMCAVRDVLERVYVVVEHDRSPDGTVTHACGCVTRSPGAPPPAPTPRTPPAVAQCMKLDGALRHIANACDPRC